ncbi:MAG TPA: hypothetical protein VGF55_00080, partial [Gemmataceae bacterium]
RPTAAGVPSPEGAELKPRSSAARPGSIEPPRLAGLADFLTSDRAARWDCPLDGGGELILAAEGEP